MLYFYNISAWSLVSMISCIYKFVNVCPYNYTALMLSGKVRVPFTGLTTPVVWLSLLKLTVLSRSAIVVQWKMF